MIYDSRECTRPSPQYNSGPSPNTPKHPPDLLGRYTHSLDHVSLLLLFFSFLFFFVIIFAECSRRIRMCVKILFTIPMKIHVWLPCEVSNKRCLPQSQSKSQSQCRSGSGRGMSREMHTRTCNVCRT